IGRRKVRTDLFRPQPELFKRVRLLTLRYRELALLRRCNLSPSGVLLTLYSTISTTTGSLFTAVSVDVVPSVVVAVAVAGVVAASPLDFRLRPVSPSAFGGFSALTFTWRSGLTFCGFGGASVGIHVYR